MGYRVVVMFFTSVLPGDQERKIEETGRYSCEKTVPNASLDSSPSLPVRVERPNERLIGEFTVASHELLNAAMALGRGENLEAPLYRCERLAEQIGQGRTVPHYLTRVFDESATLAIERSQRLASRHLGIATAQLLPVALIANVGRIMLSQSQIAPPVLDNFLFPLTASVALLTATTMVGAFYRPLEWKFRPAVAASLPAAIPIGAVLFKSLFEGQSIDPLAIVSAGAGGYVADHALRYLGGSYRQIDHLTGAARKFVSTVSKLRNVV